MRGREGEREIKGEREKGRTRGSERKRGRGREREGERRRGREGEGERGREVRTPKGQVAYQRGLLARIAGRGGHDAEGVAAEAARLHRQRVGRGVVDRGGLGARGRRCGRHRCGVHQREVRRGVYQLGLRNNPHTGCIDDGVAGQPRGSRVESRLEGDSFR